MRIRTIKPEFWSHPVLSRLTDEARLVAIGLLNVADDEGYFLASPALVRSALYPFDEDSTRIRRVLAALSRIGYIDLREHPEQGEIGCVVNFSKHQRIDRPTKSKIKPYYDSTSPRRALDEDSLLEQGREQGTGKGKEQGNLALEAPAASPAHLPFSSDAFKTAWQLFQKHRTEIRKPLKPTSAQMALKQLAAMGEHRAIRCIEHTIAKGWQGLREPDANTPSIATTRPAQPAYNEPDGWKAYLNHTYPDSVYSAGGDSEAHEWKDLPRDVQGKIVREIGRERRAS